MEQAKLDKILAEHKNWLRSGREKGTRADLHSADLRYANLSYADLRYADLRYADLRYADLRSANLRSANLHSADLRYANLDFSAFPLWCGGLNVHIDDRQAIQLLYHLVQNVQFSKNTSAEIKEICNLEVIIKKANEFHRAEECGFLDFKNKKQGVQK